MDIEYTWQSLGSMTGCSAAALIVTQFLKDCVPRFLPTRMLVWILAFMFLLGSRVFSGEGLSLGDIPLMGINSLAAALAAMGAYDAAMDREK